MIPSADRQRVIAIYREIISRNVTVKWNCLARGHTDAKYFPG